LRQDLAACLASGSEGMFLPIGQANRAGIQTHRGSFERIEFFRTDWNQSHEITNQESDRSGAAAAMVLAGTQATQAVDLLWEWTTTQAGLVSTGTFVTDGGPFTSSNPTAGTYILSQFEVKTSAAGATIGSTLTGDYTIVMPSEGFIWSSVSANATQFFRSNGGVTNGMSFNDSNGVNFGFYTFNNQMYGGWDLDNAAAGLMTLQAVNPVPEPSTYALGAIATGVMAAVARRRKARKA
jgi:hypothetical protein